MKYVLHNLCSFMRNEKIIFFIMVICILSSALILNFSYGLYRNFDTAKKEANADLKSITAIINKDAAPTHKQVQEYIESLTEDARQGMCVFIAGKLEEYDIDTYDTLDSRFTYENGRYEIPEIFRTNAEKEMYSGRMITNEEESDGANVAVVGNNGLGWNENTLKLGDGKTYIVLFGKRYEVVGENKAVAPTPVIPFLSIPDDFIYDDVMILDFANVITKPVYEELKEKAEQYMPNAMKFPELKLPDADSITLYNNIMLISLLIAVLSVLNFAMLYHFILEKRSKNLAIIRLCGCTKGKAVLLYLGECIIVSVPIYLIGTLGYIWLLYNVLDKLFIYMVESYYIWVYFAIFAIYFIMMILIMGIMITCHIKGSIVQEWKEGQV